MTHRLRHEMHSQNVVSFEGDPGSATGLCARLSVVRNRVAHCQIFHFLVVIELEELIIVEKLIIEGVSRCLMGHGIGIPLNRQKIFLKKVTL